jgi:hypothetical protein
MYPVMDKVSPQRERELRAEWKRDYKSLGKKYPRLPTIGLVELSVITVPAWARKKAVKGLTITETSVWLRRINARELMREDQRSGGIPQVTWTSCRPCRICKRTLIGLEAEHRFFLDLRMTGEWTTCGPDCAPLEHERLSRRGRKATV